MDYEYVDRMNSDIEWFIDNADIEHVRNERTVMVTCNGETREVAYDSIKYALELINQARRGGTSDDNARMIALVIDEVPNEPDELGGCPAYITKYRLEVTGIEVTMDTTWSGGDESMNIRYHATDVSKRKRLRIFALVRPHLNRVFDNLPGLSDYTFEVDLTTNVHTIDFK